MLAVPPLPMSSSVQTMLTLCKRFPSIYPFLLPHTFLHHGRTDGTTAPSHLGPPAALEAFRVATSR